MISLFFTILIIFELSQVLLEVVLMLHLEYKGFSFVFQLQTSSLPIIFPIHLFLTLNFQFGLINCRIFFSWIILSNGFSFLFIFFPKKYVADSLLQVLHPRSITYEFKALSLVLIFLVRI
jgi:hypothetical protein